MARSRLIETVTSFWIDAYWNNEYEQLPDDSDGHVLYRYKRGDYKTFTTFLCGVEFNPEALSAEPSSIVISRRQFHESVFDSVDVFIRGDTIGRQRQGFGFSYDALDSESNFNRLKNHQLNWDGICSISVERMSRELEKTHAMPLLDSGPNL